MSCLNHPQSSVHPERCYSLFVANKLSISLANVQNAAAAAKTKMNWNKKHKVASDFGLIRRRGLLTNLALEASRRARLYKATRFAMHFLQATSFLLLCFLFLTAQIYFYYVEGTHSYEIVTVKNQAQLLSTLDCQSEWDINVSVLCWAAINTSH